MLKYLIFMHLKLINKFIFTIFYKIYIKSKECHFFLSLQPFDYSRTIVWAIFSKYRTREFLALYSGYINTIVLSLALASTFFRSIFYSFPLGQLQQTYFGIRLFFLKFFQTGVQVWVVFVDNSTKAVMPTFGCVICRVHPLKDCRILVPPVNLVSWVNC